MEQKKIATSELTTSCPIVYKPDIIAIITISPLSFRVTTSGEENEWLGRWSFMIIKEKKIINAYRPCEDNNNIGVPKTIIKQCAILEERDMEEINIRKQMIN